MIQKDNDILADIEDDLATLARLAASQSHEDVRLFVARLVRKYRHRNPALANLLDESLKTTQTRAAGSPVLRRNSLIDQVANGNPPVDRDSQLALIRVFDDREGLAPPLLPIVLIRQIKAIISERKERDRLLARNISPTRSAVLVGPPGVGKTLTARWIACSLGKPLWVLDLTAVMSSFLGKTGTNVRAALDHAKTHTAVLLLDEIDAIAKRRSDETDIGELKRLVTVILQEVDQWPDTGLLLAATNHPELVDTALWRRFDAVLHFSTPEDSTILAALSRFFGDDATAFGPWLEVIGCALRGQSLSDVERAVNSLRRGNALQTASVDELVTNLVEQGVESLGKADRMRMAIDLARAGNHTHQQISRITGVSRDTIRKHAGPSPRRGRGMK